MINVLVIPAGDEPCRVERMEPNDLEGFRSLIGGGWLENVTGPTWNALLDEDGKMKDYEENPRATYLLQLAGVMRPLDYAVGTVLFVGHPTSPGNSTDVPESLVAIATALVVK